ncbi:HD domain-containing protein [Bacillus sp. JZ8]
MVNILVQDLKAGFVVKEDVCSQDGHIIMPKGMKITKHRIQVLRAFLIKEIRVQERTSLSDSEEEINELYESIEKYNTFVDQYKKAIEEYKEIFQGWQSGMMVDMIDIRKRFIPFFKDFSTSSHILNLCRYQSKENYFYHHPVAVGLIAAFIGRKKNIKQEEWVDIALSGLLMDCGFSRMNEHLFLKRIEMLNETEKRMTKVHPSKSYQMVRHLCLLTEGSKLAVLQHHERLDGSGYPLGLTRSQVHPYSKVVAVADTFYAMVSGKERGRKKIPFVVLEEMRKTTFGKYDFEYLTILMKDISSTAIGRRILLNNNQRGEIVFINQNELSKPLIRLDEDASFLDLSEKNDLYIAEIL